MASLCNGHLLLLETDTTTWITNRALELCVKNSKYALVPWTLVPLDPCAWTLEAFFRWTLRPVDPGPLALWALNPGLLDLWTLGHLSSWTLET